MPTTAYPTDTQGTTGSSVAPGAGAPIVSVSPDAAAAAIGGTYSARIIIELSGTAETQLNNLRLNINGVSKIAALPSTPGPAASVIEIDRLYVPANASVQVVAVAAATGGAIYTVTLLLTRVA